MSVSASGITVVFKSYSVAVMERLLTSGDYHTLLKDLTVGILRRDSTQRTVLFFYRYVNTLNYILIAKRAGRLDNNIYIVTGVVVDNGT